MLEVNAENAQVTDEKTYRLASELEGPAKVLAVNLKVLEKGISRVLQSYKT